MSSSRGSEGSRGNTNEDDIEDDIEDENKDSTEEHGGEPYTHNEHVAEKDQEQSGEWRAQHPPGVCSRPHLGEQQQASKARKVSKYCTGNELRKYFPKYFGPDLPRKYFGKYFGESRRRNISGIISRNISGRWLGNAKIKSQNQNDVLISS